MDSVRGGLKHLLNEDEGPLTRSESVKSVIFVQAERIEKIWENLMEWGGEKVHQGVQ